MYHYYYYYSHGSFFFHGLPSLSKYMELLHVLSRKNSSGESVAIRLQLKEWGSAGPLATLQYETRIHKCSLVGNGSPVQSLFKFW